MKKEPEYDNAFYFIGWIAIALLIGLAVFCLITNRKLTELGPGCAFYKLTGLYCPGCGGTRAAVLLTKGHLLQSFYYHPVVLYGAIVGGIFMITQTLGRLFKTRFHYVMHFRMIYIYILLALTAINWVVKDAFIFAAGIHLLG